MLRKYRYDNHDVPKDPDIARWFQALGHPPVAHEPLGARARLMARIEAQQRRGAFAWLSMANPAFAMGLAAALLLSIGLNVWWGKHFFGTPLEQTARVAIPEVQTSGERPLSTYRLQAHMQPSRDLGALVAARPLDAAPMPVVGFTPEAVPVTAFIRLGREYADTLATLSHGQMAAAASRLGILMQTLDAVQAPPALSQYLNAMQHVMTQQGEDAKNLAQFVALFEPLYEEVYAGDDPMAEEVILFRAGAWLENVSLAATLGDQKALQQARTVPSLSETLGELGVPPTVLKDLGQLDALLMQPALTDRDVNAIRDLVGKIQQSLSA